MTQQGGKVDLSDPTAIAVEVTEIKGQFALLSAQVSAGLGNVSSQLAALQGEVRDQGRLLRAVETSQHDSMAHSQGLERLARAIDGNSLEFARWRETHEAENRGVSDKINRFTGMLIGLTLLGGALTTAVVFNINGSFSRSDERLQAHVDKSDEGKLAVARRITVLETAVERLKEKQ